MDELISQPDTPVSGGVPLTNDDFRKHRAPLRPPNKVGSIYRPSYAIRAQDDATRSPRTRRIRTRQVTPHCARTIARPPTVTSPRLPLLVLHIGCILHPIRFGGFSDIRYDIRYTIAIFDIQVQLRWWEPGIKIPVTQLCPHPRKK